MSQKQLSATNRYKYENGKKDRLAAACLVNGTGNSVMRSPHRRGLFEPVLPDRSGDRIFGEPPFWGASSKERVIMKTITKLAAAALLSAATVAVTTATASASVVCNREGECWHVANSYNYHPEFGVVVH